MALSAWQVRPLIWYDKAPAHFLRLSTLVQFMIVYLLMVWSSYSANFIITHKDNSLGETHILNQRNPWVPF